MIRRPRVTVRRLMTWVVVAAVALALGRSPFDLVRERQRFAARAERGRRWYHLMTRNARKA